MLEIARLQWAYNRWVDVRVDPKPMLAAFFGRPASRGLSLPRGSIAVLFVMLCGCSSTVSPAKSLGGIASLSVPGNTPAVFAPGVVSLPERHEFGSVVSADGRTVYFAIEHGSHSEIQAIERTPTGWAEPVSIIGSAEFSANDPMLSPDESRLYFITKQAETYNIGFVERTASGAWGPPQLEPEPIRSPSNEYYISFTRDGAMVFASDRAATSRGDFTIYLSRWLGAEFSEPQPFPAEINSRGYEADAFIDPDSRYLIFSSNRRGGKGRGDLYISFARADGGWTAAAPLSNGINTKGHELCPFVTRDRRFLFYTSDGDIYWIDAGVITSGRAKVPGG